MDIVISTRTNQEAAWTFRALEDAMRPTCSCMPQVKIHHGYREIQIGALIIKVVTPETVLDGRRFLEGELQ